jgi:drug/metabolite transporter (DMT)-like permease
MGPKSHRTPWKSLLAFAIVYLVWGSAYFAIRIGVREVPPFLLAAMRFLFAGVAIYLWKIARGERSPSGRQWMSASLLALLIVVLNFGLVFWAEQRVPSGITGVLMALVAVFIALIEIFIKRTQQLTLQLALALLTGIGGVAILLSHSMNLGAAPIDRTGAAALIVAAMAMAVATALMSKLSLPESSAMSSAAQMLTGGMLLTLLSAGMGEFHNFHPSTVSLKAWLALLYLVVAASIVTFTAYVWLIHHESPTKAGTYAYVNPVVAVLVGYFLGGEALDLRTMVGALFILISVIAITTMRVNKPGTILIAEESA